MSVAAAFSKPYSRLQFFIALSLSLMAAFGTWWWFTKISEHSELVSVVVAAHLLTAPKIMVADDLTTVRVPREALPANALVRVSDVVGKLLTRDVSERSIITSYEISYQGDPSSVATLVPAGRVGFVLSSNWLATPIPQVKKNDLVTLYVAWPRTVANQSGTGVIVKAIPVLAMPELRDGAPASVLLGIDEPAVQRLLQARASQFPLAVAVESLAGSTYFPAVVSSTP